MKNILLFPFLFWILKNIHNPYLVFENHIFETVHGTSQ